MKVANLKFDVHYPYSFSANSFWKKLLSSTVELRKILFKVFETLFEALDSIGLSIPYSVVRTSIGFLDSLKNHLLGNLHFPHNDFLQYGIYSVTIIPYQLSSSNKYSEKYISMLEVLLLTIDEVDTHYHSGTMQYFFTDSNKHVSLKVYPYPILTFTVSLILPYAFKFPTIMKNHGKGLSIAMCKTLMIHFLCLVFYFLLISGFYFEYVEDMLRSLSIYESNLVVYDPSNICSPKLDHNVTNLNLQLASKILTISLILLLVYKVLSKVVDRILYIKDSEINVNLSITRRIVNCSFLCIQVI